MGKKKRKKKNAGTEGESVKDINSAGTPPETGEKAAGGDEEAEGYEEIAAEIAESLKKAEKEDGYGKLYLCGEGERPPKEALSGGKIFSLTFGVSLLLLMGLMLMILSGTGGGKLLWGHGSAYDSAGESGGDADHSLDSYHPAKEDGLRVLCVVAGEEAAGGETETPAHYWLLRIHPSDGEMAVVTFPDSVAVPESGETLREAAAEGSTQALSAVRSLLGKETVDRVVYFTRKNAADLVNTLGGMEWEFRDRYKDDTLDIPAGRHRLDGETVLALMDGGAKEGSVLPGRAEILTAFLGQKLTEEAFNRDDGLFQALAARSTGTLSAVDYYEGKKFVRWFLRLGAGYRTITVGREGGKILSEDEIEYVRGEM